MQIRKFIRNLLIWLLILGGTTVYAQVIDADEMLKMAKYETDITHNYAKAIEYASKGIRAAPDNADIRNLLAKLYILTKQPEKARMELKRVLEKDVDNADAKHYLSMITPSAVNGKYTGYSGPAEISDQHDLLIQKAKRLALQKMYPEAYKIMDGLRGKDPGDMHVIEAYAELHVQAGKQFLADGNRVKADKEFEAAFAINPSNADASRYMTGIDDEDKNYSRAIDHVEDQIAFGGANEELLIKKASLLLENKNYAEAYSVADAALVKDSSSNKLRTISADAHRTVGQQQLIKKALNDAKQEFLSGLHWVPNDKDLLEKLISIETEQKYYRPALARTNQALEAYPGDKSLLVRKEYLLDLLDDPWAAYAVIQPILNADPGDTVLQKIERDLFPRSRKNRIAITYNYTSFELNGRPSWGLVSLYYLREGRLGSVIGRVSYADRNVNKGAQFEVETYPKFGNGDYAFADIAYSSSVVFPKIRGAFSYFKKFDKGWEGEGGLRYQYNDRSFVSYAASIGKYIKNYWINFRAFITPDDQNVGQSFTLTGRYYFQTKDDYATLIAGTGVSPDDRARNFQFQNRVNLTSVRVSAGFQHTVLQRHIVGILATWNKQEYSPGVKGNEYDIFLNYQFRF